MLVKGETMSLRESMNRQRGTIVAIAMVAIVVAISHFVWRSGIDANGAESGKAFFTTDDGRTWFVEDVSKLPPFDHTGKTAYRCYVYTIDDGKTKYVSYLERYSEEAKAVLRRPRVRGNNQQERVNEQIVQEGTEVKRPGTGESGWVKLRDPRAMEIMMPKAPDNSNVEVTPVEP